MLTLSQVLLKTRVFWDAVLRHLASNSQQQFFLGCLILNMHYCPSKCWQLLGQCCSITSQMTWLHVLQLPCFNFFNPHISDAPLSQLSGFLYLKLVYLHCLSQQDKDWHVSLAVQGHYFTAHIYLPPERFTWQQIVQWDCNLLQRSSWELHSSGLLRSEKDECSSRVAQCSLLFHSALNRGQHVLVQSFAVNIRFLLAIFPGNARNVFLWLPDVHHMWHYCS